MNLLSQISLRSALLAATVALSACAPMSNMMSGMDASVPLKARLEGRQEVPPVDTPATGTMEGRLNKTTNVLTWKVTYSGLSGPATAGHFHGPASMGQNAGVVLPFTNAASPIEGQATLTPAQAADLTAGKWYVNIHTAANPAGEIRGQVMTGM